MAVHANILDAIGHTPMVELKKIVPAGYARILVKCEFMNPCGSIKDRIAKHIIERAEQEGLLRPGGVVVENTSGNTGLGLAMAAAVKGYRCVFTMPDKMSMEKVNMLKSFGAEVVITPTDVPGDSPEHYVNTAKRIASETPGAFYVNQYHSPWNIEAHEKSTGPEIFEQTDGGKFDAFVTAAGTGGTLSGIGRYMKKHAPHVKIVGTDPIGSIHYHYFHTQTLATPHVYLVEGAGEDILCDAMDFSIVDDFIQVSDKDSFQCARRLVREEGLFCGGSSGTNLYGALQVAKELGEGKTVVTIAPDSATRYTTKHLSDAWMKDHGLLEPRPDMGLVEDLLAAKQQRLVTASTETAVRELIGMLREHGVSQIPVVDGSGKPVGIVHEVDILSGLHDGQISLDTLAKDAAHELGGLIYPKARLEELFHIFASDQVAVVVDGSKLVGIISKIDLIDFMSSPNTAKPVMA